MSYLYTPADNCIHYQTVPERMQHIAKIKTEDEVYVFLYPDGRRDSISASELFVKSKALARSLVSLGIKKGDTVATCLLNDKNALICTFGVICAGAVVAPLPLRDEDGSDLQLKLNNLGIKCLVLYPGVREELFHAWMNFIDQIHPDESALSRKVSSLHKIIATSQVNEMELLQLDDLMREANDPDVKLPRLDLDEEIFILTTSGSTGEPKFVPHTHRDAVIIGNHAKESIGYDENDALYSERRIAWLAGFPFTYLHAGVKVVTLTEPIANFSDHVTFTYHALQTEKCTIACIFPSTVTGLLDWISSGSNLSSLRMLKNIHIGCQPLASSCMNALGVITDAITNLYGTSEGGFMTSNHVTEKKTYVNFCAGKPLAGVEIKVVDSDGLIVKRGNTGTILARSGCMSGCYYVDRNTRKPVTMTNGWMNTDDVGYITEDGSLVVAGRKSDLEGVLYAGGRYVRSMSTYFEALVKEHPHVLDAGVVSVPDDVFGDLMCACVIPLPGRDLSTDVLNDFCKSKMVSTEDPWENSKLFMLFKSFPKLYSGKPNKLALREEAIQRKAKQTGIERISYTAESQTNWN